MIVRILPEATAAEREAIAAAVAALGVRFAVSGDAVDVEADLADDDALALAALPGVAGVAPTTTTRATMREAILDWIAGAAAVLGVLVILTVNIAPPLGAPADPMKTPQEVVPSWPLLAWYSAVDKAPAWAPAPLLFCVAALVLMFWPVLGGRRLAERRPVMHSLVGIAALLVAAALAAYQVAR